MPLNKSVIEQEEKRKAALSGQTVTLKQTQANATLPWKTKQSTQLKDYGNDLLNQRYATTLNMLNNLNRKNGTNFNIYDDAESLMDTFMNTVRASYGLNKGVAGKDYLKIGDNEFKRQMEQTVYKYQYSGKNAAGLEKELARKGYQTNKAQQAQTEQNVIGLARKLGAGASQQERDLAAYYDALANSTSINDRGSAARQNNAVMGTGEENRKTGISTDERDFLRKQAQELKQKAQEKDNITLADAEKYLSGQGWEYGFAKEHPGDLSWYAAAFSRAGDIVNRAMINGVDKLNDKEKEVYYALQGNNGPELGAGLLGMGNLSNQELQGYNEWGRQQAAALQNVNGLYTQYTPDRETQYILNQYRQTPEGAKAWAQDAIGTPEEQEAKQNEWFVARRAKFDEVPTVGNYAEDSKPQANFSSGDATLDRYYRIINNIGGERDSADLYQAMSGGNDPALTFFYNTDETDQGKFTALMNRGQFDEARDYLDYMQYAVNEKTRERTETAMYNLANNGALGAIAASALSVPLSLTRGVGALDIGLQNLRNQFGEYKPVDYNRMQAMGAGADAARQGVQDQVNWEMNVLGQDVDLFDFLYGTAMSGVDSMAAGALGSWAGPAVLGLGAAQNTMMDLQQQGGNDRQVMIGGALAGAFETLFEHISIGQFYDEAKHLGKRSFGEHMKNILALAGINFSEEFNTELFDMIAEESVMGSKAQTEKQRQEYLDLGLTEEEADARIAQEKALRLLEAGFGGALMGGAFGGISNVTSDVNTSRFETKAGKVFDAESKGTLKSLGSSLPDGEAKALARKYDPEKATDRETGALVRAIMQELPQQAQGSFKETFVLGLLNSLEDMSPEAAGAIADMMSGQQLAPEQIDALAKDQAGMQAMYDLLGVNGETGRAMQKRQAETEQAAAGPGTVEFEPMPGMEARRNVEPVEAVAGDDMLRNQAKTGETAANMQRETEAPRRNVEPVEAVAGDDMLKAPQEPILYTGKDVDQTPRRNVEPVEAVAGDDMLKSDTGKTAPLEKRQGIMGFSIEKESGGAVARMEDGSEQSVDSLDISDAQKALAQETADMDTEAQGVIMRNYEGQDAVDYAQRYAKGMKTVYNAANNGRTLEDTRSLYAEDLTEEQRKAAWEAGRAAYEKEERQAEADTRKTADKAKKQYGYSFKVLADGQTKAGGVYLARVRAGLTNTQADMLRMIERIAEDSGAQVRVYDTLGAENGSYQTGSNIINVALDAEGGMLTRTVSHELFHYIKEWNSEAGAELQKTALDALRAAAGYDYEGRIAQIQRQYRDAKGQELSRDAVEEEMAAEAMLDQIGTEEGVRELIQTTAKSDATLLQKISNWIQNTVAKLKSMMEAIGRNHAEVRALNGNIEYLEKIGGMFRDAAQTAGENYLAAQRGMNQAAQNDADIQQYQADMRTATSQEDAQAARDGLASAMFARYVAGLSAEDQAKVTADYEDAFQRFQAAMAVFGGGQANSLSAALKTAGLPQNAAGMNSVLAYAARQMAAGAREAANVKSNPRNEADTKAPVEETRDLIAVHNVKSENINKILKMGGLPMPSIAITKSDMGHSGFGDVSFVFGKDTIDPRNYGNTVYGNDAWTPTFDDLETAEGEDGKTYIHRWAAGNHIYDDAYEYETEFTAENVADALIEIEEKERAPLSAKAAKMYGTLEDVKNDRTRLQPITEKEYREKQAELRDHLQHLVNDITNELMQQNEEEYGDRTGFDDDIEKGILSAGRDYAKAGTLKAIKDAMRNMAWAEITDEQAKKIEQIILEAREIPTEYFEAKPRRVVELSEVQRAVVPDTMSAETIQRMKAAGVREVVTYPAGDEEARKAAVNERQDLMFSLKADADYMAAAERGDEEEAQRMVDEAAKAAGYTDRAYHGSNDFGFTVFDMDKSQGQVFVSYQSNVARTYGPMLTNKIIGFRGASDALKKMNDAEKLKAARQYFAHQGMKNADISIVTEEAYQQQAVDAVREMMQNTEDADRHEVLHNVLEDLYLGKMRNGLVSAIKEELTLYGQNDELRSFFNNMLYPAFQKGSKIAIKTKRGTKYYAWEQLAHDMAARGNGIYDLYTKPGNQLVVDAKGSYWNEIHPDWDQSGRGWKTREIAEYAKENGYDSVRINDVYDHGGNNSDIEGGHGDIGIFFNSEDVKSADPITYDDAGNVIPLSERFNEGNTDIRFELRGDTETDTEAQALEDVRADADLYAQAISDEFTLQAIDDFAQIYQAIERVARNMSGDGTQEGNWKKRTYEIANRLKTETGSTMSTKEAAKWISRVFQAIDKGGYVSGEVLMYARDFGMELLKKAPGMEIPMDETTKEIRRIAKERGFFLTDDMKSEIAGTYGSVEDFRRKNFGKMRIVKQSASTPSLAEVWTEDLNRLNPGVFAEDTAEADMPRILDGWLETSGEKKYTGEFGTNATHYATSIALELMMDYLDAPWSNTRIKNLTARYDRNVKKVRTEYQSKYEERMSKDKERKEVRERKDKIISSIRQNARYINTRVMNPKNTRHIPEEYRGAAEAFVYNLYSDRAIFSADEAREYAMKYAKWASDEKLHEIKGLSPQIQEELGWLAQNVTEDTPLRKMTEEQLNKVDHIVGNFRKIIEDGNTVFMNGKQQDLDTLVGSEMAALSKRTDAKNGTLREASRKFFTKELTPIYYAMRVGGVVESGIREFIEKQSDYIFKDKAAKAFYEEAVRLANVNGWLYDKPLEMTTKQGDKIILTKNQAMSLYAWWKRETTNNTQSAEHLRLGGFTYDTSDKDTRNLKGVDLYKPHIMMQEDFEQISDYLSQVERDFADKLVDYLSNDVAAWCNEMSMRMYGYNQFEEKYYFPYPTDPQYRSKGLTQEQRQKQRLYNWGGAKPLTEYARNPLKLQNFTDLWLKHVNEAAMYSTYAEAIQNLDRVTNYVYDGEHMYDEEGNLHVTPPTSLKKRMEQAYGREAVQYLETLLDDLNGGVRNDDRTGWSKATSLFKKGSVAANLSVVLQQPSAFVRAMSMVNPKYFAKALTPSSLKGVKARMYENSGAANIKDMGRFDTNVGKSAEEWMGEAIKPESRGERIYNGMDKWTGKGAEIADEITWCYMYAAVENEIADNTDLERGTEAFNEAAGKRFDEVMTQTQVYDSTLAKSEYMRGTGEYTKMLTSFMAEPTLTANMLINAAWDVMEKRPGAKKAAAVTLGVFVGTAFVNALLKSFATAFRRTKDEDKGRTYWEKYLAEAAGNFADDVNPFGIAGMLPVARDIVSLAQGYDVERADMSIAADLIKYLTKAMKADSSAADWLNLAGAAGNMFGIPARNVIRDVSGIWQTFFGGAAAKDSTSDKALLYGVLENIKIGPWSVWDSSRAAYYDRMEEALKAGDMDKYQELRGYVEDTLQVKSDTVDSGIKKEIRGSLTAGLISDDKAIELLEALGMDSKKAFDTAYKWAQTAGHEDEEDFEYNKYGQIQSMIAAGQDISAEVKRFTDHGTSDKTMESAVKGAIKNLYTDGTLTDSQAESSIKKYLGITDKEEIHWLMDEWAYKRDNGAEASYSKYVDVYDAVKNGTSLTGAMKEMTQNGYTEKDVRGQIKSKISEWYKKGELTKAQTEQKLRQYAGITDSNDLYWAMDQMDYEKSNPKGEYRKYNEFYRAVETGSGLQSAVKRYLDHGVKAETMASQITSQYKAQYVELYRTNKTKAAELQARLLTAYELLGYDRNKKIKDIAKWVK